MSARAGLAPIVAEVTSAAFAIACHRDGGDTWIALRGELDRDGVRRLRTALRAAGASDAGRIVLDLRRLSFIDSAGLRTILAAHRRLEPSIALRVMRGPRPVQRLFEVTGTDRTLTFLE